MVFGEMEPAVEIVDLVKRFGNTIAVDKLNLSIYDGEIFGLLGPNGSGKSTTLLIISTVYKPTSGDVYVYGKSVVKNSDEVRKYVGIAFQEPKALWVDKPYEILLWHAMVVGYSMSDARKVVRQVMEDLGVWEYRNKMFSELSGGNKKKVELAKVFIQKPRLAIFDEPTAQLDVITKHQVWNMIEDLRRNGSTIIVATNEMSEAERLSDRIGIMYRGKLRALGTPEELKDGIPGGDIIEIIVDGPVRESFVEAIKNDIDAVRIDLKDAVIRIYVNKGEEKIARVVDMFSRGGLKVRQISLKEPTLDDVFFYYTGAKLAGDNN
ncbi:ABC transporter [Desulfurococcaceae archaeon AG1]|jgi:ABC-2 type transport system ATP-binding protein|nr:ABC transporter [Desulfurococcaceae archaeon AG1]